MEDGLLPAAKRARTDATSAPSSSLPKMTPKSIRFIGYPIPTTPANLVPFGDVNGPGAVAGTYIGYTCPNVDIKFRASVLKHAVETAAAHLPSDEDPSQILNVFVAPEFFFHGKQGPYLHRNKADDFIKVILKELEETFPRSQYPNWLFVCGTAITARVASTERVFETGFTKVRNSVVSNLCKSYLQAYGPLKDVILDMLVNFIKNCHSLPLLEVRNRALILSNVPADASNPALGEAAKNMQGIVAMTTEKYFCSNEDLLLYDVHGRKDVVTEQMMTYPLIDLTGGDLKKDPLDKFSIFRQNYGENQYLDIAVEICLDHRDGTEEDGLHLQLVPSCGMQIKHDAVSVLPGGFVFNVDGQYALDFSKDKHQREMIGGVKCLYANYVCASNPVYGAHTQLAKVKAVAQEGHLTKREAQSADYHLLELEEDNLTVIPVTATPDLDRCYSGGPGALHIYGLKKPYALYSSGAE